MSVRSCGAVAPTTELDQPGDALPTGNAACFAGIAGLVVVSELAVVLPYLGSNLVLDRIGLDGPDSPIIAALPDVPVTSILVALLLLALAEAFRRGSDMASDVEGLV